MNPSNLVAFMSYQQVLLRKLLQALSALAEVVTSSLCYIVQGAYMKVLSEYYREHVYMVRLQQLHLGIGTERQRKEWRGRRLLVPHASPMFVRVCAHNML